MFSDNVYILFDAHVAREDRDCVQRRVGLLCEIRFRDVNVKSNIEGETAHCKIKSPLISRYFISEKFL